MKLFLCLLLSLLLVYECQATYGDAMRNSIEFFEVQHSGWLPDWNRIWWRGHSALGDGSDHGIALDGGWYDAGDYVKFGFPMAQSVTTIAWGLIEFKNAYIDAGEYGNALNQLRHPYEYFLKCHVSDNEFFGQVGDGHIDHAWWGRPEDMDMWRPAWKLTTSAPGSDLAGETAAAFAAGYLVYRDDDPNYADRLLDHGRRLYEFAYNYRGKYNDAITNAQDFYGSSRYEDELAYGALWLYRATGDQYYLDRANEFRNDIGGVAWAYSWDSKDVGAQLLFWMLSGDTQMRGLVESFLTDWYPGGTVTYTPMGLAWRDMWGANRYAANSAFIALVAEKHGIHEGRAANWAKTQIEYILGYTGPRSFVVGYGNNPPTRPHHASSSCQPPPAPCNWDDFNNPGPNPHTLYGALVGGPGSDDSYEDRRDDYVKNEVACDYNAGWQGALAGMIDYESRRTSDQ